MPQKSIDWLAVAAYDRSNSATAPSSHFADTVPMPTAPVAHQFTDDGDDNGGEWHALAPQETRALLTTIFKFAAACFGIAFAAGLVCGVASRHL